MAHTPSRRGFLNTTLATGAALGLQDMGFFQNLAPVSAADVQVDPSLVRFSPEIEPLVRLIEDTPQERIVEVIAERIKGGLSYRELLTAVQLATVRNMNPHPLGFAFHCVLAINSAHLASLASPAEHRWLPMFWAVDYFKQMHDGASKKKWTMAAAKESALPSPSKARQAFIDAMEAWDEDAADVAVTALARSAGEQEIFELLVRFGARGFRAIGHPAIYVANSRRALDVIGWQHSEAVLRSLAHGLLDHKGNNPSTYEAPEDHTWRTNPARAARLPADWTGGKIDAGASSDLLAVFRQGTGDDAADKVVELIGKGIAPQSVWDAIFVGAGEVLLRERGFIGVHSVTSANAMHYAFQTSGNDDTRRMVMLQAAAFVPQFLAEGRRRGAKIPDINLEKLDAMPLSGEPGNAVGELMTDISRDRVEAAKKMLTYLKDNSPRPVIDAARLLVFFKGHDAHDYKFSSAVFEDYQNISPEWRNRYIAASALFLRGANDKDNGLAARARAVHGA